MSETWKPVEDGWHGFIEIDEDFIAIQDDDSDGVTIYLVTTLPENMRLCRRVDAEPSMGEMETQVAAMVDRYVKRMLCDRTWLVWVHIGLSNNSMEFEAATPESAVRAAWLAVCGGDK